MMSYTTYKPHLRVKISIKEPISQLEEEFILCSQMFMEAVLQGEDTVKAKSYLGDIILKITKHKKGERNG